MNGALPKGTADTELRQRQFFSNKNIRIKAHRLHLSGILNGGFEPSSQICTLRWFNIAIENCPFIDIYS
jgi:hypothetical protein